MRLQEPLTLFLLNTQPSRQATAGKPAIPGVGGIPVQQGAVFIGAFMLNRVLNGQPITVLGDPLFCYTYPMSPLTEKPLVVSPQLASTLGLEEAVLLQVLYEASLFCATEDSTTPIELTAPQLARLAPFWEPGDIQRLATGLREKGILHLHSAPISSSGMLRFSFFQLPDELDAGAPVAPVNPAETGRSARQIAPGWQPGRDALNRLAQQGIPPGFALEQVPEFVTYWRDQGEARHSWDAKFIKRVSSIWRDEQTRTARLNKDVPMHPDWRPSASTMDFLQRLDGINPDFIEDAIPEFILYWQGKGVASSTWDMKFFRYIKRRQTQSTEAGNGKQQTTHQPVSTRATSIVDDLADRSWAD